LVVSNIEQLSAYIRKLPQALESPNMLYRIQQPIADLERSGVGRRKPQQDQQTIKSFFRRSQTPTNIIGPWQDPAGRNARHGELQQRLASQLYIIC